MSKEARYGLLYSEYEFSSYVRIQFEKFSVIIACFPLFALLFCVSYSVLFNFERAVYTHCDVYNMLPSISAAIGSFSPQREVWQAAITIQVLPRLFFAFQYLHFHYNLLYPHDFWIAQVAFFLNVVENLALVIVSFCVSSQYYSAHKRGFATFIIASEVYMVLICILQGRFKKQFRISLKWKKRCLITNMTSIIAAAYFFMRHNSFCEPYMYSLFAVAEYFVVLSNIAFHSTAALDFQSKDIVIYKYGFALTER